MSKLKSLDRLEDTQEGGTGKFTRNHLDRENGREGRGQKGEGGEGSEVK